MSFNSKYIGAQVEAWLDNIKNYSANDILEKLKTVDGSGSGLDADLLDGKQPSELNVSSATKLQTTRTIWGQLFDGSSDITGDLLLGANKILGKDAADIVNADSKHLVLGYGSSEKGWTTYIDGNNTYFRYGTSHSVGIFLNSSGNVGIGTTSPDSKLHVSGDLHIEGVSHFGNQILMTRDNKAYDTAYIVTRTDMNRTIRFGIGQSNNRGIYDNTLGWIFKVAPNDRVNLGDGHYIGIGTDNPIYKLDVNGDIHASGSVTQNSDINLKNISKDVLISLNDIAEAPLFEFTYKNDENKRIHVGTSAQYWVEKNNWFCKKQDNGYYDMEIQNLALASAISIAKEFKSYKEKTESAINNMKKEIEELKQIILNMNK